MSDTEKPTVSPTAAPPATATTVAAGANPAPAPAEPKSARLLSLDGLRGFDMFWIVGGENLGRAIGKLGDAPPLTFLANQLRHVEWEGFHFYDLIFPLFVFMTGASIALALPKALAAAGRRATMIKIAKRALILYLLGLFYYLGMRQVGDSVRLVGVLQRIAFSYCATGFLFCFLSRRGLAIALAAILIGYWAMMSFVPVPGIGAGHFEQNQNLSDYIDSQYLPGAKWNVTSDPEGLFSNLPAIGSCLLGLFGGLVLTDKALAAMQKVKRLGVMGVVCLALGLLWSLQFPIIKSLWTSSFVLVAGGCSFLLLALFYFLIDVQGRTRWATPFYWIGTNSITIYLAFNLVSFGGIAHRLIKGPVEEALGPAAPLVSSILVLAMAIALVRFLYHRKIFLRV